MAPNPKYIESYRPEKQSWIDRVLNMNKLDLVFYLALIIAGTSISVVSLVWVLFQIHSIWG